MNSSIMIIVRYSIILCIFVEALFCCERQNNLVICSNMTRETLRSKLGNWYPSGFLIYRVDLIELNSQLFNQIDIKSDVRSLTINSCNVTFIEENTFQSFSNLNYLNISNNNLAQINSDFLTPLKILGKLYLSSNNIQQINITHDKDYFYEVILNNNNLTSLSKSNFLITCQYLKRIEIQNSGIKYIEPNIFNKLPELLFLDLSRNQLQHIESNTFSGLMNLQTLILTNNIMSKVPCKIFDKRNKLNILDLSNNKIKAIDICAFESLNQLGKLILAKNNLSNFVIGTFSALHSLTHLDLSFNKLSFLREIIIHPMENLQYLDISGNEFDNFDPAPLLDNLRKLRQIDFSYNMWDCNKLLAVGKYLRSQNVKYESKILNYQVENVGGIPCFTNSTNGNENTTLNTIENTNDKYLQQIRELQKVNEKYFQQISINLQEIVNHSGNMDSSFDIKRESNMTGNVNVNENLQDIIKELRKINKTEMIYNILMFSFIICVCCVITLKFYQKTKEKASFIDSRLDIALLSDVSRNAENNVNC